MSNKPATTGSDQDKPDYSTRFQPGVSGNPKGRLKGAKDKLSENFLQTLLNDFEKNGVAAVEKCRTEDVSGYIRVIASIVPKELTINEGETAIERILDSVSDGELADFVTGVRLLTVATTSGAATEKKGIKDRLN